LYVKVFNVGTEPAPLVIKRLRVFAKRLFRKIFNREEPPEHVARGLAAGFFAAALPIPGAQIPLSIFFAWIVRGNKAVSVFPQFIANPLTLPLFAYIEFKIGMLLWPGKAGDVNAALKSIESAGAQWSWTQPWESIKLVAAALGNLGGDVIGPFAVGMVILGLLMAAVAYPLSIIALTYYYSYRLRRRALRGVPPRPRAPLVVRFPNADELRQLNGPEIFEYARSKDHFQTARAVRLLFDAQTFPAMLESIGMARVSVDLETYIFRGDNAGQSFAAALKAAVKRGVKVRLLCDGVGSMELTPEFIKDLIDNGVHVGIFRPWNRFFQLGFGRMNRRDHRKIMIVDGQTSYIGGLNIANEYGSFSPSGGGDTWRDTHARIDGENVASTLTALFAEVWRKSDRRPPKDVPVEPVADLPVDDPLPKATSTNAPVKIVSNREFIQRWRVRKAYIHAIKHARRYILIENAYFIPDRQFRRALLSAVKRGVKVAVVLPQNSDIKLIALASKALYGELLSHGVRIFEHPDRMVHSKVAVIDDAWSMVSSYNLDHRSLLHNLEAGAVILDRRFAEQLRDQVLADSAKSNEITLQFHDARPWNVALLESLAYQIRYWL